VKKILLTLTLLTATLTPAAAQHYRGFFDADISVAVHTNTDFDYDNPGGFSIGGSTSHGLQFNKLFVGIGAGALYIGHSYCTGIPLFADFRWDFFNRRLANLFVGLKAGYIFNAGDDDGISFYNEEEHWPNNDAWGGYGSCYIRPSVGVRFRLSSLVGINLALSYYPIRYKAYEGGITYGITETGEHFTRDDRKFFKIDSHRLALTVGVDF
jgi:hypothetical protein